MEEAAKETVIIVHGTFAAPKPGASPWYQPVQGVLATVGFIAKLNAALQERGSPARCWAHCSPCDQGFHWSGDNNWVARTRAAAELGNYVLNLRKQGWCCHIVAHSHGGNVVLESLHQIATALPSSAPVGKIVTLGTPFMDTMSPILQRTRANQRFLIGLSWIALIWLVLSPAIGWALIKAFAFAELTSTGAVFGAMITFLAAAGVFALLVFSRKSPTEPAFNTATQMQPKFLAIGSVMDEPWQLLHYMRDAPNPMAVETNLIRYLASSTQSLISESHQVARIYGAKSYRDLKGKAKLFLAITHLMFFLLFFVPVLSLILMTIYFEIDLIIKVGFQAVGLHLPWLSVEEMVIWMAFIVGWFVLVLLFTLIFGTAFYSAFFSPFRWGASRLGAIKGIFREIATYIVRTRGWSVVLAIAMGLEGYRHQLPRIERYPSSVPGATYKNIPAGAQQRALAKRGAWIDRHLDNITQTFSKLVVTSADITTLQHAIEADQTLVHAAYYTDDECIAQIADWIAAKDDVPSNAIIAAEARGVF